MTIEKLVGNMEVFDGMLALNIGADSTESPLSNGLTGGSHKLTGVCCLGFRIV